jgi:TolB-like protein
VSACSTSFARSLLIGVRQMPQRSRISHMVVISRNTAFTYRDKSVSAKQVGRELGVRYLLEGSVRRSGDRGQTVSGVTV